jgi:O-antigen/teichoic acid export membrane protein
VISVDSLTVIAMAVALGLGTRRMRRRFARVAMAGVTGLLVALWLAEFASPVAGAVVAVLALVVLAVGLAGLAAGRIRPTNRRRPPAS